MIHWFVLLALLSNFFFPGIQEMRHFSTEIVDVQAEYQFGSTLVIHALALNTGNIKQAELNIQTTQGLPTQIPLTISANGDLSAKINIPDLSLQPFSRVYYWFQISFSDGSSLTSASYWFDYVDNRFNWQSNQTKWFNIFWVSGDDKYGERLQEIALAGLKQATQILPVSPDLPITIYIYPDSQSIQEILSITDPDWVAGEALPKSNMILVSSTKDLSNFQDLERQIPHELSHLLQYKLTQQNYSSAPAWLLEGLATNSETYPNPDFSRELNKANTSHSLIALSGLCHTFSPDLQTANLAYAQSASFVKYLTNFYGTDKLLSILKNSGNGQDCSGLVFSVLGVNLDTLDRSWQKDTFSSLDEPNRIIAYWPVLLAAIVLLLGLLLWRRKSLIEREKGHGINK
ncbi:MAG: peptidase MA family metallohydrolase [Anaerolineaceae bacterium]